MDLIVFVIASLMVVGGGLGVVLRDHPVHSALSLVLTLFGIAVHFVALDAPFLAAVQVIVYAGAIVVLFLFVIMLLGVDRSDDLRTEPLKVQRPLAVVSGLGIVGLLAAAIIAGRDDAARRYGEGIVVDVAQGPTGNVAVTPDGNIKQLAVNLFGDHVLAFELTSVLLIVAVAGTVMMTRKDRA